MLKAKDEFHEFKMNHLGELGLHGKELTAAKQLTERSFQESGNAQANLESLLPPFKGHGKGPEFDA